MKDLIGGFLSFRTTGCRETLLLAISCRLSSAERRRIEEKRDQVSVAGGTVSREIQGALRQLKCEPFDV